MNPLLTFQVDGRMFTLPRTEVVALVTELGERIRRSYPQRTKCSGCRCHLDAGEVCSCGRCTLPPGADGAFCKFED